MVNIHAMEVPNYAVRKTPDGFLNIEIFPLVDSREMANEKSVGDAAQNLINQTLISFIPRHACC